MTISATLSVMTPLIELNTGSERLRRPRLEDAEASLKILQEPGIALWNPVPAVVDIPSARAWCDRGADWSSGTHATFAVLDHASGKLMANVSLHAIDDEHLIGAIGYRVMEWASGRGVATRSLSAVTDWAFAELGLMRIQLQHAIANPASCRVADKCGYRLEGTMRSATVYGDGLRHDDHLHARLSTDPPLQGAARHAAE